MVSTAQSAIGPSTHRAAQFNEHAGANTTLNIDPRTLDSKDGSNEWLMYDLTRIAWQKSDFSKNYPAEPAYRHSLKEESRRLCAWSQKLAQKDLKSGKVKELEASLETLVKLNDAGLLESFVLFGGPMRASHDYASVSCHESRQAKKVLVGSRDYPWVGG